MRLRVVQWVALAGLVVGGVGVMTAKAGCPTCGRKLPPKGIMVSRRWAAERGMCYCAIPPDEIPLEPDDRMLVEEMVLQLPNPVHDWCGDTLCEVCKR